MQEREIRLKVREVSDKMILREACIAGRTELESGEWEFELDIAIPDGSWIITFSNGDEGFVYRIKATDAIQAVAAIVDQRMAADSAKINASSAGPLERGMQNLPERRMQPVEITPSPEASKADSRDEGD